MLAPTERIGVMVGPVGFHGAGVDELAAALGDIGQALLLGRSGHGGGRFKGAAILGEDRGIDGIGFGPLALGAGEVADPGGFDNGDGEVGGLHRADHGLLIAAGGFADEVGARVGPEQLEELGVTSAVIGEGVELAGEVELQRKLGNIQADIEDRRVVHTHTYRIRAPETRGRRAQATVRV